MGFLVTYAGAELIPAIIDGLLSVGLFCTLAYLAWFVLGFVSILQMSVIVSLVALLFWIIGSFAIQEWVGWSLNCLYVPFMVTLPFRALFGLLVWVVLVLWYRIQIVQRTLIESEESKEKQERLADSKAEVKTGSSEECLDRITIKDGSKIHLIEVDELIYIQACGDYVTLITPKGQDVKELTMKYLESHLPVSGFVRIHRSAIVNVTHISRLELFGKENYRLLLKNGERLRVSLSGYRLLKERLDL